MVSLGTVLMLSKTMKLQLHHLCYRTSDDQEIVAHLHLPAHYILHRTVLFDLSFSSCANFSTTTFLFLLTAYGSAVLYNRNTSCPWVPKVLKSAGCCSRNLSFSPPSCTALQLNPTLGYQQCENPKDVSPHPFNSSPARAHMSCQAAWWYCSIFTIINFPNLISEMEVHISARDFQLIFYFLLAFQCFWNALCYRQNTLIMMGLFF